MFWQTFGDYQFSDFYSSCWGPRVYGTRFSQTGWTDIYWDVRRYEFIASYVNQGSGNISYHRSSPQGFKEDEVINSTGSTGFLIDILVLGEVG